jgi:hypothetical protein
METLLQAMGGPIPAGHDCSGLPGPTPLAVREADSSANLLLQ